MTDTMREKTSWIWLLIRLYVGYQWLHAGWHKLTSGFDASGFLQGAVAKSTGASPVVQGWWARFLNGFALPHVGLFNFLVPWGEFLVGLALILGWVTVFAACMGAVMNFAFLMSGSISTNPILLALEFILVAAGGSYAGYLGVDRWFLPWLRQQFSKQPGTPKGTPTAHGA